MDGGLHWNLLRIFSNLGKLIRFNKKAYFFDESLIQKIFSSHSKGFVVLVLSGTVIGRNSADKNIIPVDSKELLNSFFM